MGMKKKITVGRLGYIDTGTTTLTAAKLLASKEDFNGPMDIESERGITIVCPGHHNNTANAVAKVMAKNMGKSIAIVGADTITDFNTKEANQLNEILKENKKMDFEINSIDVGDYHIPMSGQEKRRMRRKNKKK